MGIAEQSGQCAKDNFSKQTVFLKRLRLITQINQIFFVLTTFQKRVPVRNHCNLLMLANNSTPKKRLTKLSTAINQSDPVFQLLLHHVIPGAFPLSTLQDEMTGVSLAGTQLRVNSYTTQDDQWNDVKVCVYIVVYIIRVCVLFIYCEKANYLLFFQVPPLTSNQ